MMSTQLFDIIERQDLDALAKVLTAGADPNMTRATPPRWTPLMAAIDALEDGGSNDALVLLLRHGAKADEWDAEKEATPLLMALFRKQLEAVRLLLACGADPNVVGAEGDSPLRWCVEQRDVETAALILCCGGSRTIDAARGPSGMTALGRAASQLDLPMVELLLSAGADPRAVDADGRTALQRLPSPGEGTGNTVRRLQALLSAPA